MMRSLAAICITAFAAAAAADDEPAFGGKPASGWVEMLQKDASPRKREGAALALTQIGTTSKHCLPALKLALREDKSPNVRRRIVGAFGGVKREEVGPLVADISDALRRDADASVRAAAATVLGQLDAAAKPALPVLLGALKDADVVTRAASAEAVGRIGIEAASGAPDLLSLLSDPDKSVRLYAAFALGRIGAGESAVGGLAPMLRSDKAPEVRREVARSLGLLGADAKSAVTDLATALINDEAVEVRREVVLAIIRMGPFADRAGDQIVKAMQADKDISVRAYAVRAIVAIKGAGAKDFVPVMAAALDKEEVGDVKLALVEELGAMGPAALPAVAALMGAQKDPQVLIRDAATAALKKVRAKP